MSLAKTLGELARHAELPPRALPPGCYLDAEFWERREELDALLSGILETIPRGEFVIRPGDHCAYCEFRSMCRKAHLPTRWRAELHHSTGKKED